MTLQFKSHRPAKAKRPQQLGLAAKPRESAKPVHRRSVSVAPESGQEAKADEPISPETKKPKEIGGPSGLEPTRYGDWEINGRCIDF